MRAVGIAGRQRVAWHEHRKAWQFAPHVRIPAGVAAG